MLVRFNEIKIKIKIKVLLITLTNLKKIKNTKNSFLSKILKLKLKKHKI